jgi:hypothetical protein
MTAVPYLFIGKTPSERRSFGFDFGLAQEFQRNVSQPHAQTITSFTVTCDNSDLTIETPVISGNRVLPTILSAYINGGVDGQVYEIVYTVVTNVGAVIQRTVLLPVAEL